MNDDTDDEILLSPRKKHKMLLETEKPTLLAPLSPLTPLPDTPYPSAETSMLLRTAVPLPAPIFVDTPVNDMDTRPDRDSVPVVVAVPDPEPPINFNLDPSTVATTSATAQSVPPISTTKGTSNAINGWSQSRSKLPRPSMGPPALQIASSSASVTNPYRNPGGSSNDHHSDKGSNGRSNNNGIKNATAKLASTSTVHPKLVPKIASIFTDTKAKADAAVAKRLAAGVGTGGNMNAIAKPREKIKARMRMREKPGTSVVVGTTTAIAAIAPTAGSVSGATVSLGGAGRVTRSTSLKRKERGGGNGGEGRGRSRAEVKRMKKDGGRRIGEEPVAVTATTEATAKAEAATPSDDHQGSNPVASGSDSAATLPNSPSPDFPTTAIAQSSTASETTLSTAPVLVVAPITSTPASTSGAIIPSISSTAIADSTTRNQEDESSAPPSVLAPETGTELQTEAVVLDESSTNREDASAGIHARSGEDAGMGSPTKMQTGARPKSMKTSSPTKLKVASRPMTVSTSTSTTSTTSTTITAKNSYSIFHAPPKSRPSSPTKPLGRSLSASRVAQPPAWGRAPSAPGSSLSTLANALEKLRMPPPTRPNTSMGMKDGDGDGDSDDGGELKGAVTVGPSSLEPGTAMRTNVPAKSPGVKRPFVVSRAKARVSVGRPSIGKARIGLGLGLSPGSGLRMGGGVSTSTLARIGSRTPTKPRMGATTPTRGRVFRVSGFGIMGRGRGVMKASRKTSLPSVMASPVKGGEGVDDGNVGDKTVMVEEDVMGQGADGGPGDKDKDGDGDGGMFMHSGDGPPGAVAGIEAGSAEAMGKGKEKEKQTNKPADAWKVNASRRASMASRALSMSLSSLPPPPPTNGTDTSAATSSGNSVGLMGPPATPVGRSTSSTYPTSTLSVGRSRVVGESGMTLRTRTVVNAGQSAPAALGKVRGGVGGHVSSGRKGIEGKGKGEGVGCVLEDCKIFVDVRTDDGDDAGALFVDMLKGMGAKIMTRVGQTCTHIVYKNGLMSTLTRYRLLNTPRPAVVGIAWVVECVEQKRIVEAEKFTVDLEGVNVAGNNKRRRSMLPKQIVGEDIPGSGGAEGSGDGDQSMEGSVTTINSDDDLPPLEKARRRQSMMLFAGAGSVKG